MITRTRRLAARASVIVTLVAAALTATAAPAQATFAKPNLSAPKMSMDIVEIRGVGFQVCVTGSAITSGTWRLDVTGQRSDGSAIIAGASGSGTAWSACRDVLENGTLSGEFQATFTYASVSGTRPSTVAGGGTWDLLTGEHSWDTA